MLQAPALLCCMPVPITHTDASLLPALQIWLYRDKATGQLKGDATVTFEDPFAAASAPSWFNGKTWSDGRSVLQGTGGVPPAPTTTLLTAWSATGVGRPRRMPARSRGSAGVPP